MHYCSVALFMHDRNDPNSKNDYAFWQFFHVVFSIVNSAIDTLRNLVGMENNNTMAYFGRYGNYAYHRQIENGGT